MIKKTNSTPKNKKALAFMTAFSAMKLKNITPKISDKLLS